MATHPKHANGNGNGNGAGGSLTQRKIEQLLAEHERIADALRTTLGLLTGAAETTKKQKGAALLMTAMRIDRERRGADAVLVKKKPKLTSEMIRAQRKRTVKFLAGFDTTNPTRGDKDLKKAGLGTMIRYGYLKAKGDGFVRTGKQYDPDVR